jgi:hypothetical protein
MVCNKAAVAVAVRFSVLPLHNVVADVGLVMETVGAPTKILP